MRVLVMSEHYQGALASIQSVGRAGHEAVVFTGRTNSANASSKFIAARINPVATENTVAAKARALIVIVRNERIGLVIPISDDDARVVALARQQAPDMVQFVTPSVESVDIASDKIATLKTAEDLGIAVPPSAIVADRADVPDAAVAFGLPVVVKVPVSTASAGTFVARTRGELKRIAEKLPSGRILVQGFIHGDRVGASGFARDGVLLEWFGFRRLAEGESDGTPPYALSENDPRLGDVLAILSRKLKWTGGIDLDLVRDKDGRSFLLEVNPRFTGTLVFADKLGIDLPRHYVDIVEGRSPKQPLQPPLPRDTLFISVVPHEVALISSNPVRWQKWAADLRKTHRFVDSLYTDDGPLMAAQMQAALYIAWKARA